MRLNFFDIPEVVIDYVRGRFETFIADELLRCRQGSLFDQAHDPNLQALLYGRSAPIAAAISITIDFGSGSVD